jgi:hypothetical protein
MLKGGDPPDDRDALLTSAKAPRGSRLFNRRNDIRTEFASSVGSREREQRCAFP